MFVRFRGKQEVSSGTLCSGCGYWIQLIFTNVFTLLQGASSSTPGVAHRGFSHQDSLTPSSKMTANSTAVPSGRLATAIHQATRVLLFSKDVLQQRRSTKSGPFDVTEGSRWIGWLPISVLPLTAVACRNLLPPWVFMWVVSFAIYLSLKWLTWWRARSRIAHSLWRSVAYLLAWPGMDAEAFLDANQPVPLPAPATRIWAIIETILGAVLLWVVARSIPQEEPLLRGWVGMLGLILPLHFGTFQIVALLWQSVGVKAKAIMSASLRSTSLGEFWGRRWNLGFRQLSHELIFRPLHRSLGVDAAGFLVFAVPV
jgi:hypothetical protein